MAKLFLVFAAVNGALVVMLGAFGAHGLKGKISSTLLAAYQTGTYCHMFHLLALMGLALLIMRLSATPAILVVAGYLWMAGILLFSGSLYGLALGGPSWLGPITPLGGTLFIAGWICLAIGVARLSL